MFRTLPAFIQPAVRRIHPRLCISILALGMLWALSGCAGSATPQLIASFPGGKSQSWQPPQPVPNGEIIYFGDMHLTVSDVGQAAGQASDLAYRYGGYLSGSTSWSQSGRDYQEMTLAVPTGNFNALHQDLLGLGDLVSESFSGSLSYSSPGGWPPYSQIQLQLESRSLPQISLPHLGWDPLHTLSSAFNVFVSIFGFLTDILIWLVVVVGPFVIIGWVALKLVRRARK